MKRIVIGLMMLLFGSAMHAQTQQGIVKTPTRRNVNGTMTQGQYIPNATVAILLANNKTNIFASFVIYKRYFYYFCI